MKMTTRALLVGGLAAATSLLGLSAASAATHTGKHRHHVPTVCSGASWADPGHLGSGTYYGLEVSGVCLVTDNAKILIKGDVTVERAASLVAINSQTIEIDGDVSVGRAAILGLGCSAELGCDGQNGHPAPSVDTVYGDITARGALALYLNGDTVHGDVAFRWGGWGPMCTDPNADDPNDPLGHDLVVKDNTIRGEVDLTGWSGCWLGFIRNTVHGDVTIANNYANPANVVSGDPPENQGLDSTEVIANTISGDLNCRANTPAAQFGDGLAGQPAGYGPNIVGGKARGECASLLALP